MTPLSSPAEDTKITIARESIERFAQKFGLAHLYFAYHAAFPLAITPHLAYQIWEKFQQDINRKPLNIPWVAVADLLLSPLCDAVETELYEWIALAYNSKTRHQVAQKIISTLQVQDWQNPFDLVRLSSNSQGEIIHEETKQAQYLTETIGKTTLEMVYIPGGTYTMGSPEGEGHDSEKPQHQVTIKPFFMGKYPVTQAQWQAVANLPKIQDDLNPNPSRFKGENRPVEQVSWYDIIEFCARLSQKTGKNYRLPSEAEWEYACRAGTTTPFHFGETITTDLANYDGIDDKDNKCSGSYGQGLKGIYREETTPVGSFQVANGFGLYDMHGNVWEWCADPWHDNYEGAPTDGRVWDENNNDNHYRNYIDLLVNIKNDERTRLLRGGSWSVLPGGCRAACRFSFASRVRYYNIGFRLVCAVAWTP